MFSWPALIKMSLKLNLFDLITKPITNRGENRHLNDEGLGACIHEIHGIDYSLAALD